MMHSQLDKAKGYFHFELVFDLPEDAEEEDLKKEVKALFTEEVVTFQPRKNRRLVASVNVTDIRLAHDLRNKILVAGDKNSLLQMLEKLKARLNLTPFVEN